VQFVEQVTAVDDQTVDVEFKIPAPRFKYEVLTEKFDTGIPIVPEHALSKQQDVNSLRRRTENSTFGAVRSRGLERQPEDLRPSSDWWR